MDPVTQLNAALVTESQPEAEVSPRRLVDPGVRVARFSVA
jgi:hypothetical protein